MPIVLSYNDVDALGTLAMNAGEVTGRAAAGRDDLQFLANVDAQRTAQATQLQQIEAGERQSALDRDFRAQQAAADRSQRQFQFDETADFNQSRLEAGLQEAQIRAQGQQQGTLLEAGLRGARDKQLHQQTLERIQTEASLGRFSRTASAQPGVSAGGFPNDLQIEQEIQQFGHLIPYGAGTSISAEAAGRAREVAMGTAGSVSGMPTDQLTRMINERPDDSWNPYLRAVVEARSAAAGQGVGAQSAQAEGRTFPAQQGTSGGRPGITNQPPARGFTTPLSGLSDAQLQQLARDPALLNQMLQQNAR